MKHFSDTRYAELFSHPYFVKGLLTHFVDEQFIADLGVFLTESLPPDRIALSIDTFFDILKSEDSEAVALFGRWINDYLRQVAASDVDVPFVEFRTGEDPSMLAENLRQWRNKNIEEGRQEGRQEIARRLIQRGLSLAEVTDLTRLSPEEIAKVSAEGSSQGK